MINYAEGIKYQREINGYTQNKLSKEIGISQQKISYYESGKHAPTIDDCIKLADFYGITLDELVGRDGRGGMETKRGIEAINTPEKN